MRDGKRVTRGQPGAQFSFSPARVKAGLLDRLAVTGVPNGDFESVFDPDPENSTTPPDHWDLIAGTGTFGPSGDARIALDTDHRWVVSLRQTGTNAGFESAIFRVPLGVSLMAIAAYVRPTGTLSSGRTLQFNTEFFTGPEGTTSLGSVDVEVPYNFVAANTWGLFTNTIDVPAGGAYARVKFYKTAVSSAYGWDLGEVDLSALGLIQPAVVAPTLLNSFQNFDATNYEAAGYFKNSVGDVCLQGVIKRASAALNTAIIQLPSGYRPSKRIIRSVIANNRVARLDIDSSGIVTIQSADDASWYSFFNIGGVRFDTR